MLKTIFFYVILLFFFKISAQTQINFNLPIDEIGQLNLYSYYPQNTLNNEPLKRIRIINGKAIIHTKDLAPGIYTIYHTAHENIYVNVLINSDENNFNVFWHPETGFLYFKDAQLNSSLVALEKRYYPLKHKKNQLESGMSSFSNESVQKFTRDSLERIEKNILKLLKPTKNTITVLDDYLLETEGLNLKAKTKKAFWESVNIEKPLLWSSRYQYVVLRNWRIFCENETNSKEEEENLFLNGVISHLGKNNELHLFLTDWLAKMYDKNTTNDLYIKGLNLLQNLPNASLDNKLVWQKVQKVYEPLMIDEVMDVSPMESKGYILPKDKSVTIVYYSESCGACVSALKKLNDIPYKVVAVRVFSSQNSLVNESAYPNIKFYHPTEPEQYEMYVPRGTPSLYVLEKNENKWLIQNIQ